MRCLCYDTCTSEKQGDHNMKLKDMPASELPREKALKYGAESLSNRELIALILRKGTRNRNVLETADDLLAVSGGLAGLARMSVPALCEVPGISKVTAVQLKACMELVQRISSAKLQNVCIMDRGGELRQWLQMKMGSKMQEELLVIYLDQAFQILKEKTLFRGTASQSVVSVREVLKEALEICARNLILVHNHPSGNTEPSAEDLGFTSRMIQAAELMDINVIDHFVVSQNGVRSIRNYPAENPLKRFI